MIHLTASTPILVATAAADFRCGVDGFVALCQQVLAQDPRSGTAYVFINRRRTMVRILAYESAEHGSGYWLMTKRLSSGRFRDWPTGDRPVSVLAAQRLRRLLNVMLDSDDD